jgi:MFS family permease
MTGCTREPRLLWQTRKEAHLAVEPLVSLPLSTARTEAADRAWRPGTVFALLTGAFALFGLTIGAQGVLWAELMAELGIGTGAFGSAQLVPPLVAIGLLAFGGQLTARIGKKRLALASLSLLAVAALGLAAGQNLLGFVCALAVLGAGFGLFETSMNGAALDWEQASGRSAINLMHAGYSAGAVAGALGAGALLATGWEASEVLLLLAAASVLVVAATVPARFPPADDDAHDVASPVATLRLLVSGKTMAALALVCMLGAVGESVANTWTVIYLRDLGAGAFAGGATFALLGGAMLMGRVVNAPVVARFGPAVSLRASGVGLAFSSAVLLVPGGGLPLAVVSFALLGLAVAGVVPTLLGAAARLAPGQSGAVASAMLAALYVSFLVSPPVIGWLAELASLRAALMLVGLSGLGIAVLAREA